MLYEGLVSHALGGTTAKCNGSAIRGSSEGEMSGIKHKSHSWVQCMGRPLWVSGPVFPALTSVIARLNLSVLSGTSRAYRKYE